MTKSHDAQLAASHALDLLASSDCPIADAIGAAAAEYEVKPVAVEAWLARSFPSNDALDEWRTHQRFAAANRAAFQAGLHNLESDAQGWADGVWKACEPDGDPDWQYCCDRFLETKGIRAADLRKRAREIFRDTGEKYDAARAGYLARNSTR